MNKNGAFDKKQNHVDYTSAGTGSSMTPDQFDRECFYQATLAIVRTMFQQGLITDEELSVIDTKTLEKYRPLLGGLCVGLNAEVDT